MRNSLRFIQMQVEPHTFVLLLQTNINATHYSGLPVFSVEFILYLINLKRIFRRHNNQGQSDLVQYNNQHHRERTVQWHSFKCRRISPANSVQDHLTQHNKQYNRKVLLSSIYLNSHRSGPSNIKSRSIKQVLLWLKNWKYTVFNLNQPRRSNFGN